MMERASVIDGVNSSLRPEPLPPLGPDDPYWRCSSRPFPWLRQEIATRPIRSRRCRSATVSAVFRFWYGSTRITWICSARIWVITSARCTGVGGIPGFGLEEQFDFQTERVARNTASYRDKPRTCWPLNGAINFSHSAILLFKLVSERLQVRLVSVARFRIQIAERIRYMLGHDLSICRICHVMGIACGVNVAPSTDQAWRGFRAIGCPASIECGPARRLQFPIAGSDRATRAASQSQGPLRLRPAHRRDSASQ